MPRILTATAIHEAAIILLGERGWVPSFPDVDTDMANWLRDPVTGRTMPWEAALEDERVTEARALAAAARAGV